MPKLFLKEKPIIIISGPTASGKSGVAFELAKKINGSIINADSKQFYQGLPLLSAQPTAHEQKEIPHFLYSTLHPTQEASVDWWMQHTNTLFNNIFAKNQIPIIVGGTGYYINILCEGISPIPPVPKEVRHSLSQKLLNTGLSELFQELKEVDPFFANKIKPFDTNRIIRGLEVYYHTKKPLSFWQSSSKKTPLQHPYVLFCLTPERVILKKRINLRLEAMFQSNIVEEVRTFQATYTLNPSMPITKTIGYSEILMYLRKDLSLEQAKIQIQQKTHQYAKRQMTWFRHQYKRLSCIFLEKDAKQVIENNLKNFFT